MIRVVIIGSGAVGESLARGVALSPQCELVQIYARNRGRIESIARSVGAANLYAEGLLSADLYILSVSDSAIETLANSLPFEAGSTVVHTAGSIPLAVLDGAALRCGVSIGVLYPMQSFSVGREVDLRSVPIFVEGDALALRFAQMVSDNVRRVDSQQRLKLHLAAVFAANFTNALFAATADLLDEAGQSLELYKPLIEEVVLKATTSGHHPRVVQSGPARRGDLITQQRHIEELEGVEDKKYLIEIYKLISKYIWETSKRI